VLPHPSWKTLLSNASSAGALGTLARALGFREPAPLGAEVRRAIGVPEAFADVWIAEGTGAIRALLLTEPNGHALREQVIRLARGLTARAPHFLWLVLVTSTATEESAIAVWSAERIPPRVAGLFLNRGHVLHADVDTVAAVAAATGASDLLTHARWLEILGREAISRRFYRVLERMVFQLAGSAAGGGSVDDRREVALLNVSRLLFLAFLETKGWLNADRGFLARVFDDCMESGGSFHRRVLWPLLFGTLNTRPMRRSAAARAFGRIPFLNGGLFQRAPVETRLRRFVVADAEWGEFYDSILQRYRFTAREETSEWNEAAIDPEMMGRAFESLMASRERRSSGAYFTPQALVERVTEAAFEAALAGRGFSEAIVHRLVRGEEVSGPEAIALATTLRSIRILDPACGSGAFLVHALERLSDMRRAVGDARASHVIRREILTTSVFGVDVNPIAVWLCELRLWLAMVIDQEEEDPLRVTPLPNLDHHVRCGDALAGGDFSVASAVRDGPSLALLRSRYARATGVRKRSLARALEREERARARGYLEVRLAAISAERRGLVGAARGRDLFGRRRGAVAGEREALVTLRARAREVRAQIRNLAGGAAIPFAFAAHYPDILARGGFDIVIGNPPWVRLHRIAPEARARLRREFAVYRDAAWESGARAARAGPGFSAQVDLAALFVERGVALTRDGGVLSYLIPAKLWRSLAGGGMRRLLHERQRLCVLEDWSDAPAAFDAAVYPALVVARRAAGTPAANADTRVTTHRGKLAISWRVPQSSLPFDDTSGAPWLILPPDARNAFDRLRRAGTPLVASGLGRPTLGVKCGFNDAFLLTRVDVRQEIAIVQHGDRTGEIEAMALRPLLRGETVRAWRVATGSESIVYPCGDDGRAWPTLPPGTRAWLLPNRRALLRRSDGRHGKAWWSLFRTEAASLDRPRVVWADVGRVPQALILAAGDRTVPINTCYVVRCRDLVDAYTLATLLNSALAAAWLGAIAEPARGGYRRFLAWTMARLPVPDDWARARDVLAPLGERGFAGAPPSRQDVLEATLDAYRVRRTTMASLLEWTTR
jgi:hypothetical protein